MSGTAHFEVFPGTDEDDYRWRLKAANGEIVATGEGYTRAEDAERGCSAVALAARQATGQRLGSTVAVAFTKIDVRHVEA